MAHLYLLFLIFSLMVAILTAGIYINLYQKYKLDIIRYYLYNHITTIVMVFFVALNFYIYLNMGMFDSFMKIFFAYTSSILLFSSPVIYTTPVFARALIGKEVSKKIKIIFGSIALIASVNGIIIFSIGYKDSFHTLQDVVMANQWWIFFMIWFGMFLLLFAQSYSFTIIVKNYKNIMDQTQKTGAFYMIVFAIYNVFIIYFDYQAQRHQLDNGQYPVGIFLQPLNLMIFSILSILVLRAAKKFHIQKSASLPPSFILKYKITDREIQIIEMILSGLSNKEIASKMFLSPSTVRNHISNIFEKTEMPTRGKLINLIKNSI